MEREEAESSVTLSGHYGVSPKTLAAPHHLVGWHTFWKRDEMSGSTPYPLVGAAPPKEPMMTQDQWIQKLRDCAKTHTGGNWALGDLLVAGTNEFGRKSYAIACQATGYGRVSLYRIARTAAHFPTHLRLEYIAWSTFVLLRPFPLSFLEKFLPTIGGSDLSAKLIREKAVAEYGSDPEPYRKQKIFRNVRLSTELCDRIVERSGKGRVSGAVTQILKDYLAAAKSDGKASEAVAPSDGNEPAATSRHSETSAAPRLSKPVQVDLSEPEPQTRRSPQEYLDAEDGIHRLTDRPTYDQRRAAQIAAGAQPIKKKLRKPKPHALRLQWVPCGRQVDAGNGPAMARVRTQKPDCFRTLEDARAAEEKNFQEKGHREEVVYCVVPCDAYHVKHIYSSEVLQRKSAQAEA